MVDVPFLAQSEDLCGGAAAAMVLRYWGVNDVQPEDFASLVDHAAGGISASDLTRALSSRGVASRPVRAEAGEVAAEIESGRPVIALLDAGGGRLHYVVIVGWRNGRVLFHDPSIGPFRLQARSEFERRWEVADRFALFVAPRGSVPLPRAASPTRPSSSRGDCDALLDPAIATARGEDPEAAVPALVAASELCPTEPRAPAALAGVRFREERYPEAAEFARRAITRDDSDPDLWALLGASLYLADEPRAALEAWNHIDEPRIDRVQVEGLTRTRQDLAVAAIGLRGRDLLTVEALSRVEHRFEDLPTSTNPRVTFRPMGGGKADLVATVGEGGLIEPWRFLVLRLGASAAIDREAILRLSGLTGRGESLEVGWRFEENRPAGWVSLDTPRLAGLPGVVSLRGLWDRQTYRYGVETGAPPTIEDRRRASVTWSDWIAGRVRVEAGLAVDRFPGRADFASSRVGIELRGARDRVAVVGEVESWASGSAPGFSELAATLAFRNRPRPRRWAIVARLDGHRATEAAPLAVWPGAGTGKARPLWLRASPLLEDGEVNGEGFGRGLAHATLEVELKIVQRGPVRLGLAAFGDGARVWDRPMGWGRGQDLFAVGLGLRFRGFSNTGFRVDVAMQPGRRDVVFSYGVIPPWPRWRTDPAR